MKALVTGANGFTGSYLVKHLLDKGYSVRGLVRDNCNMDLLKDVSNIELVYGNLANGSSLDFAADGIDIVFHVAAAYRVENVPKQNFWDVNVNGTKKLLASSLKANVKRFVHCSTVGVQGDIKNPPATEEYRYAPGDYYQQSKYEAELYALRFFKENHLPGTIVRPTGIYGPGDTRFLKLFRFIDQGKFRMIGKGEILYHLNYVEDLVDGIILAGERKEAVGEIFTLGGEEYLPLSDLVAKIASILHKPVPSKMHIPVWPVWFAGLLSEIICKPLGIEPPLYRRRVDFFVKQRAFDISKAKKLLGYKPKVSLDEGLCRTAIWYRQNGLLSSDET